MCVFLCVCVCDGVVIHINSKIARQQHQHDAIAAILQTELRNGMVQLFYLL